MLNNKNIDNNIDGGDIKFAIYFFSIAIIIVFIIVIILVYNFRVSPQEDITYGKKNISKIYQLNNNQFSEYSQSYASGKFRGFLTIEKGNYKQDTNQYVSFLTRNENNKKLYNIKKIPLKYLQIKESNNTATLQEIKYVKYKYIKNYYFKHPNNILSFNTYTKNKKTEVPDKHLPHIRYIVSLPKNAIKNIKIQE